jgi:prolyl-tRNA synthetase
MKDAYSFHVDAEDARREYQRMYETYGRIFERCGLTFRPVEAGNGGDRGLALARVPGAGELGRGRHRLLRQVRLRGQRREGGGAAAEPSGGTTRTLERVATPAKRTVEEVSAFLGEPPARFIKTLLFAADGGSVVAALVRGDHEVSETKLQAALGGEAVALADEATVERVTGAPVGFAGPVGLARVRIVADASLRGIRGAVSGANRADEHLVGIDQARDLADVSFADLRQARAGDRCARCDAGTFGEHRGIEVGQVFYLGTKYSQAMKAMFLGADGVERPIEMGCYGIGITRTVAAAIEQHHDDAGIVWPSGLAPYGAHVVQMSGSDAALRDTAERVAADLEAAGVDALLDDRDERPGVKFKDADLIGLPVRVTAGARALARGAVEVKRRNDREAVEVPVGEVAARVASLVGPR